MKKEKEFQASLIKEIKRRFPECMVLKNDANYIQGIPDLSVLLPGMWAVFECKRNACSERQSNQEYYIDKLDHMSFARFIHPGNKQEVLDELQQAYESRRTTRFSESK